MASTLKADLAVGALDMALTRRRPSQVVIHHSDQGSQYIESRLERFDLPATVLLRELRAKGYEGAFTILRELSSRIKDGHVQRRVHRFETEPGRWRVGC